MTNEVEVAEAAAAAATNALDAQLNEGREVVAQVVTWVSEKGVDFALNLAVAAVILLLGWLVIRLVGYALKKALMRGKHRQTLFVNFACSVVTKACWAVLLIMIASRLGLDVAPLIAGLGVTGFILGFACQESLSNLASGMMIAVNEPFRVGDVVDAAGFSGKVKEVTMMATVLETPDSKRVVIPNKSVWGGPIVNYTTLGIRRVDLQVGVDYGTDLERAAEVIREAVLRVPGVLADPAPGVAVAALAESAVTFNVRPWSAAADYWTVASATLVAVKEELSRAGITIPFPQLVVHDGK